MASIYQITVEQGADFLLAINYKDPTGNVIDLTSYTARMHVRSTYSAPAAIITLTTENDRIRLDGANGVIFLVLSAPETTALPASKCVYDLELVGPTGVDSKVTRLIQGNFIVDAEVTR